MEHTEGSGGGGRTGATMGKGVYYARMGKGVYTSSLSKDRKRCTLQV